jgi:adenylate cyclase
MPQSLSKLLRAFFNILGISFGVTTLILLLTQDILFEFTPLKRAELSLIDMRFQKRGSVLKFHDSSKVVIVEISQESFKSLPEQWPWPRTYFARLVRNLKRAGALAVGIDVIFSSGDSRDSKNDEDFRRALHETGNIVLAGKLESEQHEYTKRSYDDYDNIYIDSLSNVGIVNTRVDADGVLRRYMPFGVDPGKDRRIPTFAFSILNVSFNKTSSYTAEIVGNHFQYLDKSIPRYDQTSLLVNYYGPSGTFRRMKFEDILDDKDFKTVEEINLGQDVNTFDDPDNGYLYDGTFRGKIVLVGSTMPEEKDLFSVPIAEGRQEGDNQMYGVEIHANVIQNILDKNFIIREPLWITAAIVFGLSLFTFALTAGLKAIKMQFSALIEIFSIAVIAAELFILYWVSLKLFTEQSYLADMMSPFLAIIVSYVGSTVYHYVTERKQKVMIKNMFSHYVNRDVVNELIEHPEKLQLSGERREMTVMFTDIENFTALAEKMKAEKLVAILNDYLNEMTAIVFANSGTVDKYEGDAIMAFWGAPIPQPEHALLACRTAIEMQRSLIGIRQQWRTGGLEPINVRIGINTGEMIVGNVGGSGKFEYTVIGDSVNIGSRLESANKQYKTNIMISDGTYNKVEGRVVARELDMLVVAGKTEPIRVYELIGMLDSNISPEQIRFMDYYSKGLTLFRGREWKSAIKEFTKALELFPSDYPSQIYIERSHLYEISPPPDDWNGVFVLRTK